MTCKVLRIPLSEKDIRELKPGESVRLSGIVVTARDRAHRYLVDRPDSEPLPFDLRDGVIYHCGPLVCPEGEGYRVVSAGPTTSARMNPYTPALLERYGPRVIIGKGGMDDGVREALKRLGAVYLCAVGGAGGMLAHSIVSVRGHHKLAEFGIPEAMWVFHVEDFPAVVTMDAHGHSLHDEVQRRSGGELTRLLGNH